jgi:hypothetical protein
MKSNFERTAMGLCLLLCGVFADFDEAAVLGAGDMLDQQQMQGAVELCKEAEHRKHSKCDA